MHNLAARGLCVLCYLSVLCVPKGSLTSEVLLLIVNRIGGVE